MERKLGIFAECLRGVSSVDALPLLKKAGFNCYTTYLHRREDVGKLVEAGNALGLNCESIHAPFMTKDAYCNDMWKPGPSYITMYNYYIESINSAAMYNIPSVVIHFMGNWAAPQMSSEGLHRFDEIVAYAVEKGVTIAFENMIRVGSLAYAADRYEKIPNVRFCYDFGHAHCYSGYAYAEDLEWMDIFTDRVVTTHIHDNQGFLKDYKGEIDFHLVPFEGNLDYQHVMNKMDEYGYRGGLILEVSNGRYLDMPHDEFLSMCFERLKRISDMSKMEFDAE
jgi:sugar phosphate isomerase/epimerase